MTRYGADYIPRLAEVGFNSATLGWFAGPTLISGLIMFAGGAAPALYGSRARPESAPRSGGRAGTGGRATQRVRRALVAAEFALATPLVIAAVLVVSSLDRLSRVGVGIETRHVLTALLSLSGPLYARRSCGVLAAGARTIRVAARDRGSGVADSRPPTESGNRTTSIARVGRRRRARASRSARGSPCHRRSSRPSACRSSADACSTRIRSTTTWSWSTGPGRTASSGQDVIGRRLRGGGCTTCPWTTVVGVVGNVKWTGLDAAADGTVYWPFVDVANGFVLLRTGLDPAAAAADLRRAARELDPSLPLTSVATGDELVSSSLSAPRYLSVLVGVFALTALALSVIGIYGVMAYFVQQHTRDIGIRLALGGEPGDVRRMIVLHGIRFVAAGIVLGGGAAFFTARLLTTSLYGIGATDAKTMIAVPLALLAVAVAGCFGPGRRAARLDPAEILRES